MTFFRAKIDAFDHSVDRGVVKGELLTAKEREIRVPKLPNSVFETVVIPKSKTYYLFGARFEANRNTEGR